MIAWKKLKIARQMSILSVVVCLLGFGTIIAAVSYTAKKNDLETTKEALAQQINMVDSLMEFAIASLNARSEQYLTQFSNDLGPIRPTGKLLSSGEKDLPELVTEDGRSLNGATSILLNFKKAYNTAEPAILIKEAIPSIGLTPF